MFSSLLPRERFTLVMGERFYKNSVCLLKTEYPTRIHFNIITKDGIEEKRLPLRRD